MFLYSVDGVHCRINELVHPTLARNDKLYSHKFHQAGLAYELALSIQDHGLVWMRGPFVASKHDATIFRQELKQKTPLGKKGIGDQGYRGEKGILCTPNPMDNPALRKLKFPAYLRLSNAIYSPSLKDGEIKLISTSYFHDTELGSKTYANIVNAKIAWRLHVVDATERIVEDEEDEDTYEDDLVRGLESTGMR